MDVLLSVHIASDIPVTENQADTEMIDFSETRTETNTEMIGCLCLKFSQHASLNYLFTDATGSFQLLPFSIQF